MKEQILSLLREKKEYVSGQELCERFGVSRTAVWKTIKALESEGYNICAVRNKGYLLVTEGSDLFNKNEIVAATNTKYIGKKIYFYESIGSTNVEAKRLAEEGEESGTVVVAQEQTAGRGRRGRTWISPAGTNIYFTILLKPDMEPDNAPMLTLVMAMAVAEGIKKLYPQKADEVKIKWPNDCIIGGKKVCGILTEMSAERDYIQHIVIGTGINVKKQEFPEEISATATSIDEAWDTETNRSILLGNILEAFEKYLDRFLENKNLLSLKEDYEKILINMNKEVKVLDPKGEFTGTAIGINETGELLVKLADGTVTKVFAGEVSVRGIYGYV